MSDMDVLFPMPDGRRNADDMGMPTPLTHCACIWHGQSDGPPFSECYYHTDLRAKLAAAETKLEEAEADIARWRTAHDHQYGVAGTLLREAERVGRENESLRALLKHFA